MTTCMRLEMDIEAERSGPEPTERDSLLGRSRTEGGANSDNFFKKVFGLGLGAGANQARRRLQTWDDGVTGSDSDSSRRLRMGSYSINTPLTEVSGDSPGLRSAMDPALLNSGGGNHQQLQQQNSMARHLPGPVKFTLAHVLGVPVEGYEIQGHPILSTALFSLTIMAAVVFGGPGVYYTVRDILSKFTRTTVLIGTVQCVIGFSWICVGIYSRTLAQRLVQNHNFMQCVRVHSKTFLKISTFLLTFVMGTGVVGLNCYEAWPYHANNTCMQAQVHPWICHAFYAGRLSYNIITLAWHFLVAYILFSVCRTQTVGIRQLMRELSLDAKIYESMCLDRYQIPRNITKDENNTEGSWNLWDELLDKTDKPEELQGTSSHGAFLQSFTASAAATRVQRYTNPRYSVSSRISMTATIEEEGREGEGGRGREEEKRTKTEVSGGGSGSDGGGGDGVDVNMGATSASVDRDDETLQADSVSHDREFLQSGDDRSPQVNQPAALLKNEDLLFTYWKFIRRLSVTSRYLQRWLASWIVFVFLWDGYFIIYWTSHRATLPDIGQFTFPLFVLLLVCSAYAEVNAEAQRLLKSICPTEERLAVIYYFNMYPLSVTVFSIPVTYNTMVTAILAFSVAFASKMILDELST